MEDKSPAGFTIYTVEDMSTAGLTGLSWVPTSAIQPVCLAATAAAHASDGARYALQAWPESRSVPCPNNGSRYCYASNCTFECWNYTLIETEGDLMEPVNHLPGPIIQF